MNTAVAEIEASHVMDGRCAVPMWKDFSVERSRRRQLNSDGQQTAAGSLPPLDGAVALLIRHNSGSNGGLARRPHADG